MGWSVKEDQVHESWALCVEVGEVEEGGRGGGGGRGERRASFRVDYHRLRGENSMVILLTSLAGHGRADDRKMEEVLE